VDAIEAGERDRDVWLNPLLRGSLLHDLYAGLLRRCRAANRRAATKDDGAWLCDEGTRMLADLALEMPPPSDEVRDRETKLLLEDLALFVEAETTLKPTSTPIGFEVAFGRAGQGDGEPLAQAEPVVVNVEGLTMRIAGRIDRIDQVGPHEFEIIDYKTGGYFAPSWKGTFAGGTRLQHALYGLAATELLKRRLDPKAKIVGAEYYFPSTKGNQERKRIPTPSLATTSQLLSELRTVIASGLFVHSPKEEACKWCHHGLACGRGVHQRTEAKLADAKLAPFVRLAGHE
jgi:ATP-dependent helicase/nuclease subunit B